MNNLPFFCPYVGKEASFRAKGQPVEILTQWRERQLLRRIRDGNRDAANQLVDEHYEGVYRWLLTLCHHPERAADLTQETFLQVWEDLSGFQGHSSLKTWIHRIAYHTYLRSQRRSQPEPAPLPGNPEPPSFTETVLTRCLVEEALGELSAKHRQVVLLHYWQGFTCAEIADILAVPLGTVLSRLHTARDRLRELLADERVPDPSERPNHGTKE